MDKKKTILLIDDEPDIRSALTCLLETFGFNVKALPTGKQGIEEVSQERPDVMFLDLTLPDTDGYHVLRSIREMERQQGVSEQLPILIITGRGFATQVLCETEGISGFIQKPFGRAELLEALARVLHTNAEDFEQFGN